MKCFRTMTSSSFRLILFCWLIAISNGAQGSNGNQATAIAGIPSQGVLLSNSNLGNFEVNVHGFVPFSNQDYYIPSHSACSFLTDVHGEHLKSAVAKYHENLKSHVKIEAEYVVRPGDDLNQIVREHYSLNNEKWNYDLPPMQPSNEVRDCAEKIARLNGFRDVFSIEPGQKLIFPTSSFLKSYRLGSPADYLEFVSESLFGTTAVSGNSRDAFVFFDKTDQGFRVYIHLNNGERFVEMLPERVPNPYAKWKLGNFFPKDSWIGPVLKKLKSVKGKIFVGGEGPEDLSFNKMFASLQCEVFVMSQIAPSSASTAFNRVNSIKEQLARVEPQRVSFIGGVPRSAEELARLGKENDAHAVQRWQTASDAVQRAINGVPLSQRYTNAEHLEQILSQGGDFVLLIADAPTGDIRFADGKKLSLADVENMKIPTDPNRNPPIALIYSCRGGSPMAGTVGDIIRLLLKRGYIECAIAPSGLIGPDEEMIRLIEEFLKGELGNSIFGGFPDFDLIDFYEVNITASRGWYE